jgi:hypothetical protein
MQPRSTGTGTASIILERLWRDWPLVPTVQHWYLYRYQACEYLSLCVSSRSKRLQYDHYAARTEATSSLRRTVQETTGSFAQSTVQKICEKQRKFRIVKRRRM